LFMPSSDVFCLVAIAGRSPALRTMIGPRCVVDVREPWRSCA